uniref:Uncharacterized protein n=1 Tax=Anguilla anguilla TaxID=7936 RepID=A0A0E9S7Q3_ANGAN
MILIALMPQVYSQFLLEVALGEITHPNQMFTKSNFKRV